MRSPRYHDIDARIDAERDEDGLVNSSFARSIKSKPHSTSDSSSSYWRTRGAFPPRRSHLERCRDVRSELERICEVLLSISGENYKPRHLGRIVTADGGVTASVTTPPLHAYLMQREVFKMWRLLLLLQLNMQRSSTEQLNFWQTRMMSETKTRAAEGHMASSPRQSETCFVYTLKKKKINKRSGIISKNKT